MKPRSRLIFALRTALAISVCSAVVLLALVPWRTPQQGVLRTTYDAAGQATDTLGWPWLYADGADYSYADQVYDVQRVLLRGYVWQGTPGEATWHIVHSGAITVRVDDQIVLHAPERQTHTRQAVRVAWDSASPLIEVEYRVDFSAPYAEQVPTSVALYERGPLRWHLLPVHRLFTAPPTIHQAAEAEQAATLRLAALSLLAATGSALGLTACVRVWRRAPPWLWIALFVLALGVRVIVLIQRDAADPGLFYILPSADNYTLFARWTLAGRSMIDGAYYAPGLTLLLSAVMAVFGPHLSLQLLLMVAGGAASVVALAGGVSSAFGRRAGVLAGVLAALYPPLVFYQTTLQTSALVTILMGFAVLFAFRAFASGRRRWYAVTGMVCGACGLTMPVTLVLVAAAVGVLGSQSALPQGQRSVSRRITQAAALVAGAALVILPQTLRNSAAGDPSLVSSNGAVNFFIGSNRGASGIFEYTEAYRLAAARGEAWGAAALADVQHDPLRFLALNVRKLGLLVDNADLPNNVDYAQQGVAASPLLRALSLNGRLGMTLLWIAGLWGCLHIASTPTLRTAAGLFTAGALALIAAGTAAFFILGRLRLPLVPLLIVTMSLALDHALKPPRRRSTLVSAVAAGSLVIALIGIRDTIVPIRSVVPATAISGGPAPVDLSSEIRLVGHTIETDYTAGGYLYVSLFFQPLAPARDDSLYIHLVTPDNRPVTARDVAVGSSAFPRYPPSDWEPGQIVADRYVLAIPADAPPFLDLRVGLYGGSSVQRLQRIALRSADVPALAGDYAPVQFRLGAALHLTGIQSHTAAALGETLQVHMQFEAERTIVEDYGVFLHLTDAAGVLVAQEDAAHLTGDWTTSALIPGIPVAGTRTLTIPAGTPAGDYTLTVGAYRYPNLERLPAYDSSGTTLPNGLIPLGSVTLTHDDLNDG